MNPTLTKVFYVGVIILAIWILIKYAKANCGISERNTDPIFNIKIIDDNPELIEGFENTMNPVAVAQNNSNKNYTLPCDCPNNPRTVFPQATTNEPKITDKVGTQPPVAHNETIFPTNNFNNWFRSFWKEPIVTPTPQPIVTPTPQPTATPTPQPTATPTPQPTVTSTPQPTVTSTPQPAVTPTPQPAVTPTSQPTTPSNSYGSVWVNEHNRIRQNANPNLPSVTWNQDMADSAQKYSAGCKFAHSAQLDRTVSGVVQGENLAYGAPFADYSDADIIRLWENEKKNYTYPDAPGQSKTGVTGHYTQIINKNVKEIGCYCSNCDNKKICVCRYDKIQMGGQPPY